MKRTLDALRTERSFELEERFVEDDAEAWKLYWKDIPVLTLESRILFRHRVTLQALRERLTSLASVEGG